MKKLVWLMPCSKETLKRHLLKGDIRKLKQSTRKQASFLDKPQFDDSFKGIFGIHMYNKKDVQTARELFREIIGVL